MKIKIFIKKIFFFLLFTSLAGCYQNFSSIDNYEQSLLENNPQVSQTIIRNGIKVTLAYRPIELMLKPEFKKYESIRNIVMELDSISSSSLLNDLAKQLERIDIAKKGYEKNIYFTLKIGYEDESKDIVFDKLKYGFNNYSEWLNRLLFNINEYITLETPECESIPLSYHYTERNYGMAKTRTILLVFPREFEQKKIMGENNEWFKIHIDEFGLNTGRLTFEYELPLINDEYIL